MCLVKVEVQIALLTLGLWITTAIDLMNSRLNEKLMKIAEDVENELNELE